MHTIITSCSSTRSVIPKVRVGNMPKNQTMRSALDWWMDQLVRDPPSITPRELYRGLGFMTLAKIQERFKPDAIKIVTGGLGLTDMDESITPYDFTASPKEPENIHQAVTAEPFVQTVWWRMINEQRHQKATPIADLVTAIGDSRALVIISCSKIFLRYISDDILSTPYDHRHKIRILLSASSQGSVPAQLRPMMIPFDRDFVGDMPGNRNDNNHRAAFRFLELMESTPQFAQGDIALQRQFFMGLPGTPGNSGPPKQDLEAFLKERPQYLQLPWDNAYRLTRRELGTVGGKMYFRAIFRKLTSAGLSVIALGDAERSKAVSALSGMNFLSDSNNTNASRDDEDEVLQHLVTFTEAVKGIAPKAVFSAADVCKWAQSYLGDHAPEAFKSPNKLAYIIKANTYLLGIQENGSSSYSLRLGTPA